MLRRVLASLASIAVVLAGLTVGAVPANAAITGESIDPVVWQPGATNLTTVKWTDSLTKSGYDLNKVVYVEVEWDWNATFTTATTQSSVSGQTATCPAGITFSSPGFTFTGLPNCVFLNSGAGQQKYVVLQDKDSTNRFDYAGGQEITVTFPDGVITASTVPKQYRWTVKSMVAIGTVSNFAYLYPYVPSADGTIPPPPPPITLDFDGNGGTCTPSSVTGNQGTWGTALTADQCTNGSRRLAFFSTSPTAAVGATNVRPGGPIYFLEANRLYAIWEFEKPSPVTDVVATSGLNLLKVTWKPPVSNGGDPINSYCIALRTETNANPFPRCVNSALPLEFTAALPATNSKYSFTVFARNAGGSSEPVASGPVSPYDIKGVTASRKDVLLGLGGTQVEARGDAPGLAGQTLTVEYKVGTGQWTTQANAVKVDAASKFRWSNKFPRSSNKNAVSVRFTYGSDAVVGPFVLNRGGEAGDLSAPRNIRVDNQVNKVTVTWDRPKFDGGATITGYTLCAAPGGGIGGRMCRSETGTEGTFWNLNTRQTYTFTVSAKTAKREGPRGTYAKPVDPTEASIRGAARSFDQLTADVRGEGFKKNSRFRVEMAIPVPGENPRTWNWDEVTSFKEGQDSFRNTLQIPLDASVRGERLMLRLVTPTGTVSSRTIRP